jgi:hypothetical protein
MHRFWQPNRTHFTNANPELLTETISLHFMASNTLDFPPKHPTTQEYSLASPANGRYFLVEIYSISLETTRKYG